MLISQLRPTTMLFLGNGVFDARIASTQAAREQGLSGVTSLKSSEALIFVFPSDDMWDMWMKDMRVPLDIIWLDKDKKVVYSVKNIAADNTTVFTPNVPARYVIEVPAGTIDGQKIKSGRAAVFDIDKVEVN